MEIPKGFCRVKATIKEVSGHRRTGLRPGDEVILDANEVHGRICFAALCSFISKVYARCYGANVPG